MKQITPWLNDSYYLSPLSPACKMCAQGSKMVVLITGLCPAKCFYCPLSFKKGGKDRIFANEWELDNEKDTKKLIKEAEYIDAKGAGITGGDPLIVWERVKKYVLLLKDIFGSEFHIHLYTSGLKNANYILELISLGLDEVRFHPFPESWSDMDKSPIKKPIKNILDSSADIAIEIPAIPDLEKEMFILIKWANENELNWVNLNELEFSERNCDLLINKGYRVKNEISAAVQGSQDTAINVLRMVENENFDIGVHYCSVSFKDGIQLRNRIKRRASNLAKEYEVITEDGTIIKGVIEFSKSSFDKIFNLLKEEFAIPEKYFCYDEEKDRIEIGLWILEKISNDLRKIGYQCYIVEEYPTADRLEVERIPLPF
jgi:pyruvate formate-lyase activating enzyme-like uncharacterized protein